MSENDLMIEQDKWNAILDTLRESGAMNMFGTMVFIQLRKPLLTAMLVIV